MISSDLIRGTIDLLVLESVLDAPSYGYAISRRIEAKAGGLYVIRETTLYSAVRRLEQAGFLESFKGDQTQGRPRTYYRITPEGERCYREKSQEWRTTVEVVSRFVREE